MSRTTKLDRDELLIARVRLLYQSTLLSVVGILANVAILAIVLWESIDNKVIVTWSTAMIAVLVYRFIIFVCWKKCKTISSHRSWFWLFVTGALLSAIGWFLSVIFLFDDKNVVNQVFLGFIIAGISAGAITSLSYDKRLSLTYIILLLFPVLLQFYLTHSFIGYAMSTMTFVYFIILAGSSSRFNQQFVQNMELTIEARKANAAKSEFLSSMSHELRTPMNAILSLSKLMLIGAEKNSLTENHKKNLNEIIHAADHLLELINEVLDLSKIESKDFQLNIHQLNLNNLLTDCFHLTKSLMDERSITLNTEKLAPAIEVYADAVKLKQVLLNLLSNAIKYNRQQGSIFIETAVTENVLNLVIRDTGAGIRDDKLSRIFTPFDRLDVDEQIQGTGIGLVIVKSLIEKMQGSIHCESEPGVGTAFIISLPLVSAESVNTFNETHAAEEWQQNTRSEFGDNYQLKTAQTDRKYTVLYIEDDLTNIIIVEQIFEIKKNVNLLVAQTGQEGLQRLTENAIDLVLLDINLPDMSGLEVASTIRKNPQFASLPVIALSANAMDDDIEKGKTTGIDDYLVKPIDFGKFDQAIDQYLFKE